MQASVKIMERRIKGNVAQEIVTSHNNDLAQYEGADDDIYILS
jgi:hypothetical protein